MEIALITVSILSVAGTLLPFSNSKNWIVRGQSAFRLVYLFLNILMLILSIVFLPFSLIKISLCILLPLSVFVCLRSIVPYSVLYPKSVKDAGSRSGDTVKLYIHNVYQHNDNYKKEVKTILREDADVVLLLEINDEWDKGIQELRSLYPYEVKEVREDTYGIIMMSKLAPLEADINHLVKESIPSTEVLLKINNHKLRIIGIHPEPPVYGEVLTSAPKDKEIKSVTNYLTSLSESEHKLLVGDLNDVAWSRVSRIFKKVTGMKDVRVGRGFFSTFPTSSPLQIPLDHVFCTPQMKVIDFRTLEDIGSDHLPVSVTFQLTQK